MICLEKNLKEGSTEMTDTQCITDDSVFSHNIDENLMLTRPLKIRKQQHWAHFKNTPPPTSKDERWRFSKLFNIELDNYCLPDKPSETDQADMLSSSQELQNITGLIAVADNHTIGYTPVSAELEAKGVLFLPLEIAFEKHADLINKYLDSEGAALGSDKYLSLHHAYTQSGSLLYVPKGVEIENPFVVYHWLNKHNASIFPTTIIIAEDNSKVGLVDFYQSSSDKTDGLSCGFSRVIAGNNAHVFRKSIQGFNSHAKCFQVDVTEAHRDSQIKTLSLNLGAAEARYENQVHMRGEGGHAKLYSLTVAKENQIFDQRTLQIHHAPNACSDLLYKNALCDDSQTIFSGLICVEEGAQKTDAYQTNRNLLLSKDAQANSLPGLKIKANDVKCSHGATSGQLDERELFYMLSRGIPKAKAQELLVFGFFEEVIEKLDSEELADNLRNRVQDKFKQKVTVAS